MSLRAVQDLVVPASVIAVLGMMLLPLPGAVLDLLLMFNISFALCLLLGAVYLSRPETFTSLPSILLLATLFRLGLNVATTRLILSSGEAPEVVEAFSQFVAGGNLLVGFVVFLIVTLVQFLVIAKGAERVAEVSARFALDALPGKQMAIDADMRSGIMSFSQASQKRVELQKESRLFGALDGAMKFVKGDAIAGLVITLLNIVAGIAVGLSQHSLGFSEALSRFTYFTIGDGLVSQVPALLVAVSAGIAVTRVSEGEGSFLGRELFSQIAREPQAILIGGLVIMLMACVPGLPSPAFLLFGLSLSLPAGLVSLQQVRDSKAAPVKQFQPQIFSPILFKAGPEIAQLISRDRAVENLVQELRTETFEEQGILLPDVQYDLDKKVDKNTLKVLIRGALYSEFKLREEESSEELFSRLKLGLKTLLGQQVDMIVDDNHTKSLLELYRPVNEEVIKTLVPDKISLTGLTTLLRQLVREGVGISEFSTILQAVSEFYLERESGGISGEGASPSMTNSSLTQKMLLLKVRLRLGASIKASLAEGPENYQVLALPMEVDELLQQAFLTETPVPYSFTQALSESIKQIAKQEKSEISRFILLCSPRARALAAEMLFEGGVSIPVLGFQEVRGFISIEERLELPLSFSEPQIADAGSQGDLQQAA